MISLQQLLRSGVEKLRQAGVDNPRLDAEVLLIHILGWSREKLFLHLYDPVQPEVHSLFREVIERRVEGTPVAYLTGQREFMSLVFAVTPDVLIPRPETELLVERIIADITINAPGGLVVDVGTGSGAIGVSVAMYVLGVRVAALDISPQALQVARKNARNHGVDQRIDFIQSDLLEKLTTEFRGKVDWMAANLPYIPSGEVPHLARDVAGYEPHLALDGGADGLELYRRLIPQAWEYLKPGGWLGMEIGPGQGQLLQAELAGDHWAEAVVIKDYAGLERFVVACKAS
ncbi:MAG: peptide chain release factor N(5)-glutamine methyltransferase [Clostridia bacterium]|nr:peptide chain release factor N(5)-glutamine methyltransferase [Clostridia bacterium]